MKQILVIAVVVLVAIAIILVGITALLASYQNRTKKIRDGIIACSVVAVVAAIVVCGIFAWVIPIRNKSKNYNLTTIEVEKSELPEPQEAVEDGYVELSQITMHYVKYGTQGHDVILIHGNGGSTDSLKSLATLLAASYTVYCVDDRCQGLSSDPGYITYELMAMDVHEFIEAKCLDKPYIVGHSDGGMVGIALAANYPSSVGALISCGSNSNPDTFNFSFRFGVAWNNMMKEHNKLNDLMLTEPDFTPEYLARITAPTYIVAGEFDIMPLSDSVYIHNNIKDSRIAIMKWGDHSSYFGEGQANLYVFAKAYFEEIESR